MSTSCTARTACAWRRSLGTSVPILLAGNHAATAAAPATNPFRCTNRRQDAPRARIHARTPASAGRLERMGGEGFTILNKGTIFRSYINRFLFRARFKARRRRSPHRPVPRPSVRTGMASFLLGRTRVKAGPDEHTGCRQGGNTIVAAIQQTRFGKTDIATLKTQRAAHGRPLAPSRAGRQASPRDLASMRSQRSRASISRSSISAKRALIRRASAGLVL
jgi:hypothetical protein